MNRLVIPIVGLALSVACSGPAPSTRTSEPPETAPATTFDLVESTRPLFTVGQSWSFDVERTSDDYASESPAPAPVDRFQARCTVTEQRDDYADGAVASMLSCSDTELAIHGIWLRTPRGLYLSYGIELPPDDAAVAQLEREPDALVLAASPVALQEAGTGPDGFGEWTFEVAELPDGTGWCSTRAWLGGDITGGTICLTTDGPVSGVSWFDGGMHTETAFQRTAP